MNLLHAAGVCAAVQQRQVRQRGWGWGGLAQRQLPAASCSVVVGEVNKALFFFRISITSVLYLLWLFVHVHLKTRGLMLIGPAC